MIAKKLAKSLRNSKTLEQFRDKKSKKRSFSMKTI